MVSLQQVQLTVWGTGLEGKEKPPQHIYNSQGLGSRMLSHDISMVGFSIV